MSNNFSNQDLRQLIQDSIVQENVYSIFGANDESMSQTARRWDKDDEYDNRNELYTKLLENYIAIYTEKARRKDKYKLAFFIITMTFFVLIIIGGMAAIGYVAVYGDGNIADIGTIIGSVAGIISALIVIPKIIAEHLFPVDEEHTMIDMVKGMQENDAKIRDILSKNSEQPENE